MDFKLKNFGKIADADIKLDGITVICGDNNTGKSTVGKALFCFYNSLYNFFMKKYEISEYQYEWREEDGSKLEDGAHIIFVNAAYDKENDASELAKLMHDFRCSNASQMLTEPLANKTRKLKETPEGVDTMCKAIEELWKLKNVRTILLKNLILFTVQ